MPTYYKGITFRSRLEARWAIILDELGIAWEYEPEAIVINTGYHDPFGYLPDFYLPQYDAFLEIKGAVDEKTYVQLMKIGYYISGTKSWYPKETAHGKPFLLAGPLLHEPYLPIVWSIYNRKGTIFAKPLLLNVLKESADHFYDVAVSIELGDDGCFDVPPDEFESPFFRRCFTEVPHRKEWHRFKSAIKTARNARFDRGHHV